MIIVSGLALQELMHVYQSTNALYIIELTRRLVTTLFRSHGHGIATDYHWLVRILSNLLRKRIDIAYHSNQIATICWMPIKNAFQGINVTIPLYEVFVDIEIFCGNIQNRGGRLKGKVWRMNMDTKIVSFGCGGSDCDGIGMNGNRQGVATLVILL